MSRTRNYSEPTVAAIERFFIALDAVIESKEIRGVNTYCTRHGIDRRHLIAQRKDPSRGYFEVGWMVPLVTDYGVNARWLLTGKGKMTTK